MLTSTRRREGGGGGGGHIKTGRLFLKRKVPRHPLLAGPSAGLFSLFRFKASLFSSFTRGKREETIVSGRRWRYRIFFVAFPQKKGKICLSEKEGGRGRLSGLIAWALLSRSFTQHCFHGEVPCPHGSGDPYKKTPSLFLSLGGTTSLLL